MSDSTPKIAGNDATPTIDDYGRYSHAWYWHYLWGPYFPPIKAEDVRKRIEELRREQEG